MRIRLPIHPAFLKEKENVIENVMEISEEKLKNYMPEVSKRKIGESCRDHKNDFKKSLYIHR